MPAPRSFSWLRRSLPARLMLAATVFVGAVAAVHVLSLDRLFRADQLSSEVRNRWIGAIRSVGDLEDAVSDLRAAEAEVLLSRDPAARETRVDTMRAVAASASRAMASYAGVAKDPDEIAVFDLFSRHWKEHVDQAEALAALAEKGDGASAFSLFDNAARASYERADGDLRKLIDLTVIRAEEARSRGASAVAEAHRWISDLIIGVLVLFIALGFYLWRTVSRPLFRLGALMRRLAAKETDFVVPFESWRDEVGELARALAVLRRNTIELIESRKRLAGQAGILTRSLDKERALATEQRNFISTISHEFRTPLMAIDGHAQRLVATAQKASPEEIVERAGRIRAAAFRMTTLVSSLMGALDVARGDPAARMRPFDLKRMLEGLARYYEEIGPGTGFKAEIDGLPDSIMGDPQLLYQVFSNLMANAVKYSPDGALVTLKAQARDGEAEIAVEDHGIGIPPGELDRVRERYYRASNVGSIPGTGMGLHLVDTIVSQHGGRLAIESAEGNGTRVVVVLPLDGRSVEQHVAQDPLRRRRSGDGWPDRGSADRAGLRG
jgi:two-component system, OmpR family, sensor kinase